MKLLRITGWGCVAAVAFWSLGLIWFAVNIAEAVPRNPDEKTGAIVVLTGGEGRLDAGLALFAEGKADHLFISGVNPDVKPGEIAALWSGAIPLPGCCISLGYKATNTEENAAETLDWLHRNKLTSIRLVTSSYHMSRSLMEFQYIMPDIKIIPNPVRPPAFVPWSQSFIMTALREYNKALLTWLRLRIKPA